MEFGISYYFHKIYLQRFQKLISKLWYFLTFLGFLSEKLRKWQFRISSKMSKIEIDHKHVSSKKYFRIIL